MPILALGVSDTSLGPNSPIGFVLKHPTNKEGQIKINNLRATRTRGTVGRILNNISSWT